MALYPSSFSPFELGWQVVALYLLTCNFIPDKYNWLLTRPLVNIYVHQFNISQSVYLSACLSVRLLKVKIMNLRTNINDLSFITQSMVRYWLYRVPISLEAWEFRTNKHFHHWGYTQNDIRTAMEVKSHR